METTPDRETAEGVVAHLVEAAPALSIRLPRKIDGRDPSKTSKRGIARTERRTMHRTRHGNDDAGIGNVAQTSLVILKIAAATILCVKKTLLRLYEVFRVWQFAFATISFHQAK